MTAFSTEDLLQKLYDSDIFTALDHDRLNLQQLIILNNRDVLHAFAKSLGLPTSDTVTQFRTDYNRKYYTHACPLYLSTYQCFNLAAKYGDLDAVRKYVESGSVQDINRAFRAAAKGNHRDIIDYLRPRLPNLSKGLILGMKGAIEGDHLELFNYLIGMLPLEDIILASLLEKSAEDNAVLITNRIIELLMPRAQPNDMNFNAMTNRSFISIARATLAAHVDDLDTIKTQLESYKDPWIDSIDSILSVAAKKHHTDIINYLFEHNPDTDVDTLIEGAIDGGHFDLYDQYYTKDVYAGVHSGLGRLIERNQRDLIHILLTKNSSRKLKNTGLDISVKVNNRELIQYFINLGANDWERGEEAARTREDTQDLILYFSNLRKYEGIKKRLFQAIRHNNPQEIPQLMIVATAELLPEQVVDLWAQVREQISLNPETQDLLPYLSKLNLYYETGSKLLTAIRDNNRPAIQAATHQVENTLSPEYAVGVWTQARDQAERNIDTLDLVLYFQNLIDDFNWNS